MHYAVALLLVGIAGAVLFKTASGLVSFHGAFWVSMPTAINDVLFVVIILEIFRTILAHFHEGGFQLRPFLIIGIISAVRHVLTVGAQLSLQADAPEKHITQSLTELGVNAAVVLALVIALVLVDRCKKTS